MKYFIGVALFMAFVLPRSLYAVVDTVNVPDYFETGGTEGTLNNAVTAAINDGTLNNKVFKLKAYGLYVLTGEITVPVGKKLTIVANEPGSDQNSAPPQIAWSTSGTVTTTYNFNCFGDISLKNIWLFYATTSGNQTGTSLRIQDSPDTINGQRATFEGCLFDYSQIGADASGAISVTARHFRGTFTNCYFRNCSDRHFRYYGRAVSFPYQSTGWHTDSLKFVNCTFANMGYVIMQEGSEYTDFLSFNHCTFINTMMYVLESPWWYWLSVTNSMFVNTFMFGDIGENNGNPEPGMFRIDSVSNFGFSPPFTDAQRHILLSHSAYVCEPWLVDWMAHNPYSDTASTLMDPKPAPMLNQRTKMFFDTTVSGQKVWPFMNRQNLYDGVNPNLLLAPSDIPAIKRFLYFKWTNNADTNWAFDPGASLAQSWPLPENAKIGNATLRTAAMGGYPVGDLFHWDKTRYNSWKAQEATEKTQILYWLTNGITGVVERPGIPTEFALSQNYPNPFNPTTKIDYSIPQAGHASMKIYNLLGQEVATLFDGEQKAGNYTVTFDAAKIATGIYFYKLQYGENSITKKLVLMK
ncbi:MAG: T9SS type A sorting domain-containing protein [Ignavibacteriae bacterium]|nr:T9SS type A sorting domain-containing protein [Ignavibacteriota bacterium]